ncbi:helix-turn-helix domain-containing protein [Stenotrophomonas sp. NPDC087984]
MSTTELAPGANVAVLRKERGWSQIHTARQATISLSLLSKIEVGDRTLTPAVAAAHNADISIGRDIDVHGLTVGPQNTFTHELATRVDLGRPQDALRMTDDLPAALAGLPPTRVAPTHINYARAQLDLGDRDGALENLSVAWDAAPQMARIHPMGREVFRVVSSLHRRSNAELLKLSKLARIEL